MVALLTDQLKGNARFVWSMSFKRAFQDIKSVFCSSPILAAPWVDQLFELLVDASDVGPEVVQLNYSVIEKETLALIWALHHFDVYVGSSSALTVYTDHNSLTFLDSVHCPNCRLIRWMLDLQLFCLDIRHMKGLENVVANALSRAPQA